MACQYIDSYGKYRGILTTNGFTIITFPQAPTSSIECEDDFKNIAAVSVDDKKLLRKIKGSYDIVSQQVDNEELKGLWVELEGEFGFIPAYGSLLKNVDIQYGPSPYFTDSTSELDKLRQARRIAEYLKQYTLFEYMANDESLSEDDFVVIEDYDYISQKSDAGYKRNIRDLNQRLLSFEDGNRVMYDSRGKLIVTSHDFIRRLLYYIQASILTNEEVVRSYAHRKRIRNFYKTLTDFTPSENQFIFMSKEGVMRWKETVVNRTEMNVLSDPKYESIEPYFYSHPYVLGGQTVMIQNTIRGTIEGAWTVSKNWSDSNVNLGYCPSIKDITHISEHTMFEEYKPTPLTTSSNGVYIFANGGKFSAILPLNT